MTASTATSVRESALSEAERDVLGEVLNKATSRSRRVIEKRQELRAAIALGRAYDDYSDEWNAFTWEVANLCAALSLSALERARTIATLHRSGEEVIALHGADLDRFLRPIFEDAGVGDDFVSGDVA